jgi:hypothetical protein
MLYKFASPNIAMADPIVVKLNSVLWRLVIMPPLPRCAKAFIRCNAAGVPMEGASSQTGSSAELEVHSKQGNFSTSLKLNNAYCDILEGAELAEVMPGRPRVTMLSFMHLPPQTTNTISTCRS